jgi:hypothetical protein
MILDRLDPEHISLSGRHRPRADKRPAPDTGDHAATIINELRHRLGGRRSSTARESDRPPRLRSSLGMSQDVEDVAGRVPNKKAAHTPRLISQRMHNLAPQALSGSVSRVDIIDLDRCGRHH